MNTLTKMVNFRVQSGKFTPGRKIYTDGVSRVTDNYQVCARWSLHIVDFVHETSLSRLIRQLLTSRCCQYCCWKSQRQKLSSGLHPDRDQGLPRCQTLERAHWSFSIEPSLLRICNKYRLQPVSHLARILQGQLFTFLSICKAVIGFWAASSASLHLPPDSSGIGWDSTPEHNVSFNQCTIGKEGQWVKRWQKNCQK